MHIPDGFLSTPVWATLNAISVPAVGYMARRAQSQADESRAPLLGVLGAFIFAAQMINFPIAAGTSGHLLGSALLSCTVGPAAAAVVMSAVLAIQAFVFQDGGILALGANVFNLAIAGVLAGYLPYHFFGAGRFRLAAIFAGGVFSVLVSAGLALGQIALSGVPVHPKMMQIAGTLFIVGALLEGAITVAVVRAIEKINPGWVQRPANAGPAMKALAITAGLLAIFGVVFASTHPDSLEKIASQVGLRDQVIVASPFPGYQWSGLQGEWFAKSGAGLAGLLIVFMSCLLAGRYLSRQRSL